MAFNRLSSLFDPGLIFASGRNPTSNDNGRSPAPGLGDASGSFLDDDDTLCIVCQARPQYFQGNKSYPTCGLTCANILKTLCQVCHSKPRYQQNGRSYPTCGLQCAAKLNMGNQSTVQNSNLCGYCQQRPRLVLNNQTYPHCSRTCRDAAAQASSLPSKPVAHRGPIPRTANLRRVSTMASLNSSPWKFNKSQASRHAPILLEIPKSEDSYDKVLNLFQSDWKSPDQPIPTVHHIFAVVQTSDILARHEQFKQQLYSSSAGPVQYTRRWIAVGHACLLMKSGNIKPCQNLNCTLCDIIRRNVFSQTEFPRMIPAAGTSNKADKLAFPNATQAPNHKAMLLTKVVSSEEVEMSAEQAVSMNTGPTARRGFIQLTQPDETGAGTEKASDQLLVFVPDAITPRYLVIYS